MTEPLRFAFITFTPGFDKQRVLRNLSVYGDVRVMTKIAEVATVVTDLVSSLEIKNRFSDKYCVDKPLPAHRNKKGLRSTNADRMLETGAKKRKIAGRRDAESLTPEPLPKDTPAFIVALKSLRDQAIKEEPADELTSPVDDESNFRAGEDSPPLAGSDSADVVELLDSDENADEIDAPRATAVILEGPQQLEDEEGVNGDGSEEGREGMMDDVDKEMGMSLQAFLEKIKAKHAPPQPRQPAADPKQARCAVCNRWVKTTDAMARINSHVYMHAQRQRYACSIDGCDFSDKTEFTVQRHIYAAHNVKKDPIDLYEDKEKLSESWRTERCIWAPKCFPDFFEATPGGELYMNVNGKKVLASMEL